MSCAEQVFASMTDAQRVGQLFVIGLADDQLGSAEIAGIEKHHFGSVSFIVTTTAGVDGVRAVADAVQAQATDANTAGVKFFVAANQEGGLIQALRGPGFSTVPSAVVQGEMKTSTLRKDADTWGQQLVDAGVNFNFAPVMDVVPPGTDDQNAPIGQLMREYGHDPQTVGTKGSAFADGMADAGVATSAKHFPGLGRVLGNTDFTADVVDDATYPNDPYLGSFQAAITAGVPFVMVALATYTKIDPDHLAVFSPVVMSMLRDDLGFDGVIISDDIGNAEAIADIPAGTRAIDFLTAGGDMIITKFVQPADVMAKAVVARMSTDDAFRARVDEAVTRILETKATFDLLPC
jgi:beta-N-acetylhexosaminidase